MDYDIDDFEYKLTEAELMLRVELAEETAYHEDIDDETDN